ncbi:hypothetical protein OHB24_21130 [Kribbella sp. NBC_00482]|uniref:hypothetical protein n=1 Tax=Kribbella sp. NBC_00482 TaxID=2975968 RepID=UPI002E189DF2
MTVSCLYIGLTADMLWRADWVYGLTVLVCAVIAVAGVLLLPFRNVRRHSDDATETWGIGLDTGELTAGLRTVVRWDLWSAVGIMSLVNGTICMLALANRASNRLSAVLGGALAMAVVTFAAVAAMRYLDGRLSDARFLVGLKNALLLASGSGGGGPVQRVAVGRNAELLGPGGGDLMASLPYLRRSLERRFGRLPAVDPAASIKAAGPLFVRLHEQAKSDAPVVHTDEVGRAVRAVLGRLEPDWVQPRDISDPGWRLRITSSAGKRIAAILTVLSAAVAATTSLVEALK